MKKKINKIMQSKEAMMNLSPCITFNLAKENVANAVKLAINTITE